MYEIWLGLNIVAEIVAEQATWAVVAWVAFVVLVAAAARGRRAHWKHGGRYALWAALAVGAVTFALVPGASGASFADLSYAVDWALLVALAVAAGAIAAAFAWPAAALALHRAERASARAGGPPGQRRSA